MVVCSAPASLSHAEAESRAPSAADTGSIGARGIAGSERHVKFSDDATPVPKAGRGVSADTAMTRSGQTLSDVECSADDDQPQGCGWWPSLPVISLYKEIGSSGWIAMAQLAGAMIITPAAYSTLPSALARLSWWGLIALALSWAAKYYTSILMCSLHTWNVTIRHCRYRDLGRSIWGKPGWMVCFIFQQLGALGNNVGVQLASALMLKDISQGFQGRDNALSLHWCIAIFGLIQMVLSQFPTTHTMRHVTPLATLGTLAFAVCAAIQVVFNGRELRNGTAQAFVLDETHTFMVPVAVTHTLESSAVDRMFHGFTALVNISYSFVFFMNMEVQSLVRPPVVRNGKRAIHAVYNLTFVVYLVVAVTGYWAYGNTVSQLLPLSLFPHDGALTVAAQLLLVCHSAVHWQLYAQVSYEVLDNFMLDPLDSNLCCPKNIASRMFYTAVYIVTISFVASMLPSAFDDLAAIFAVLGFFALDLIIPLLMWNAVMHPGRLRRAAHLALAGAAVIMGVLGLVGAIWSLATHFDSASFFQDTDPMSQLSNSRL